MKLTLANPAARQKLRDVILAAITAANAAITATDNRLPDNVAKLFLYLPDIAANAGNELAYGDSTLVESTGVGQEGRILPAQRFTIYDFETNQGSLHNVYVMGSGANMVLDVGWKVA